MPEKEGGDLSKDPPVKITTIKYLVDIIICPDTGLTLDEMSQELANLSKGDCHPSIQQILLSSLARLIAREGQIQHLDLVWQLLERLASIAVSLNEWRTLNERDWDTLKLPQIIFENARPEQVLDMPITSIPPDDRIRWAALVDGMFGEQAGSTFRWLLEFLKRHGASEAEIQIVREEQFGPLLATLLGQVSRSFVTLKRYLPKNSWHLRIIRQQVTSYQAYHEMQMVAARLAERDPDWKKADDGKNFSALVDKWKQSQRDAFSTLVNTYQRLGESEIDAALRATLEKLLRPEYMFIAIGSPQTRSPPWETLMNLLSILRSGPDTQDHNQQNWKRNIRPLLQWLSERVATMRAKDRRNGVLYDNLQREIEVAHLFRRF